MEQTLLSIAPAIHAALRTDRNRRHFASQKLFPSLLGAAAGSRLLKDVKRDQLDGIALQLLSCCASEAGAVWPERRNQILRGEAPPAGGTEMELQLPSMPLRNALQDLTAQATAVGRKLKLYTLAGYLRYHQHSTFALVQRLGMEAMRAPTVPGCLALMNKLHVIVVEGINEGGALFSASGAGVFVDSVAEVIVRSVLRVLKHWRCPSLLSPCAPLLLNLFTTGEHHDCMIALAPDVVVVLGGLLAQMEEAGPGAADSAATKLVCKLLFEMPAPPAMSSSPSLARARRMSSAPGERLGSAPALGDVLDVAPAPKAARERQLRDRRRWTLEDMLWCFLQTSRAVPNVVRRFQLEHLAQVLEKRRASPGAPIWLVHAVYLECRRQVELAAQASRRHEHRPGFAALVDFHRAAGFAAAQCIARLAYFSPEPFAVPRRDLMPEPDGAIAFGGGQPTAADVFKYVAKLVFDDDALISCAAWRCAQHATGLEILDGSIVDEDLEAVLIVMRETYDMSQRAVSLQALGQLAAFPVLGRAAERAQGIQIRDASSWLSPIVDGNVPPEMEHDAWLCAFLGALIDQGLAAVKTPAAAMLRVSLPLALVSAAFCKAIAPHVVFEMLTSSADCVDWRQRLAHGCDAVLAQSRGSGLLASQLSAKTTQAVAHSLLLLLRGVRRMPFDRAPPELLAMCDSPDAQHAGAGAEDAEPRIRSFAGRRRAERQQPIYVKGESVNPPVTPWDSWRWLGLDWLQAAEAAFGAGDFYAAIYLAEAWLELEIGADPCEAWLRKLPAPRQEERRSACRRLLAASALKLGERDLPYAFSDPLSLDARSELYRHEGSFFDRLAAFDIMSSSQRSDAGARAYGEGIATSLFALHLHTTARLVGTELADAQPSSTLLEQGDMRAMQAGASWRLTAWDVPEMSLQERTRPALNNALAQAAFPQRAQAASGLVLPAVHEEKRHLLDESLPACLDILGSKRTAPLAPLFEAVTTAEIACLRSRHTDDSHQVSAALQPAFCLYLIQELRDAARLRDHAGDTDALVGALRRQVGAWTATPLPDDFDATDYLLSLRAAVLQNIAGALAAGRLFGMEDLSGGRGTEGDGTEMSGCPFFVCLCSLYSRLIAAPQLPAARPFLHRCSESLSVCPRDG